MQRAESRAKSLKSLYDPPAVASVEIAAEWSFKVIGMCNSNDARRAIMINR
jgi:hypothetical protein